MPRVLVAEDTDDIRALVRAILALDGIDVLPATNGAEALELIFAEAPDAVLLDIAMPLMDGIEVLERLAAENGLPRIPVMMLTSHSQSENVEAALRLGARDFLVKPFDPRTLRERVGRLLSSRVQPGARVPSESVVPPELRITPKVLVVDDDPATVETARKLLRPRFDVVTARTGAGALAVAAHERPDLIVMDVAMPVMDGAEALARLRGLPELARAKVLAISTGDDDPRHASFDGVVRKPFRAEELLRQAGEAIGLAGMVSFVTEDDVVIARFHASRHWDLIEVDDLYLDPSVIEAASGGAADLRALARRADSAFARMLQIGRHDLVLDLSELSDLVDCQLGAVMSALATIGQRARGSGIECCIVAPQPIPTQVAAIAEDLSIRVFWRLAEAYRSLCTNGERRPRALVRR